MSAEKKVSANGTPNVDDAFQQRLNELNRQMMKLPEAERRQNWQYYFERLTQLNNGGQ